MRERPILFSAPMVRALLDGRKTQTRRAMKPQWPIDAAPHKRGESWRDGTSVCGLSFRCPYGQSGDRLWVRETFGYHGSGFDTFEESAMPVFRADTARPEPKRWIPSIHMPREVSRITLEVTGVRVERLQAISDADAIAEGCPGGHGSIPGYGYNALPGEQFMTLWDSLNGAGAWATNPWVWVADFQHVRQGGR